MFDMDCIIMNILARKMVERNKMISGQSVNIDFGNINGFSAFDKSQNKFIKPDEVIFEVDQESELVNIRSKK